jgi:hypothetical protein
MSIKLLAGLMWATLLTAGAQTRLSITANTNGVLIWPLAPDFYIQNPPPASVLLISNQWNGSFVGNGFSITNLDLSPSNYYNGTFVGDGSGLTNLSIDLSASNTWNGTFIGDGSALTNLPLPDLTISNNYNGTFYGDALNLTNINGSNIITGTIDAGAKLADATITTNKFSPPAMTVPDPAYFITGYNEAGHATLGIKAGAITTNLLAASAVTEVNLNQFAPGTNAQGGATLAIKTGAALTNAVNYVNGANPITANISVLVAGSVTNTLYFTNGLLMRVTSP